MIGRSLANYRILEKLGEGGMGRVYLAEDTTLGRRVALKILAPDLAADPKRLERFQREVRTVAAINHPGIVTVYSVGEADELHYFAMEHVQGQSVADCLPKDGWAPAAFVRLALQLIEAVAAAHQAGVVHRDLKPHNIMVTEDGAVKVLDFGLAKQLGGGPGQALTRVGELLGTVAYMAPEQLRGGEVDERTDLFALGSVLYEMATGRHPFDTRDLGTAMMSILHERPRPASARKPQLGAGLDPILARCLEKEPGGRYPSVTALREALAEYARQAAASTVTLELPGRVPHERRAASRPTVWSLPRARNLNFSGRDEELEELRRRLAGQTAGVPLVAVVGIGGVGKTQLAVEYAYRFARDYSTVWWVPADDPAGLGSRYASLAGEIGLQPRRQVERTVAEVREWLAAESRWLLVLDNAEEPAAVRPYLPDSGGGQVLVTSRNPAWRGLGEVLELGLWPAARAAAFLERRTGDGDSRAARELNKAVGGLPLALEQAAAYIETSGQSLASYVRLFGGHRRRLLSQADPESGDSAASVITTWDLSFQQVARASPAAEQLLDLCAFLAPDDIPIDLLGEAEEHLPEPLRSTVADELALDEALATLLRYSLIGRHKDALSVHRLVQLAVRGSLDDGSVWLERALRMVSAVFPADGFLDTRVWPRCLRLLPHAVSCLGRLEGEAPRAAAELLDAVGSYLSGRAQHQDARPYLERALEIEEAARGRDHPRVAVRLNDLGRMWAAAGEPRRALECFERALAIEEAALGPEHPNVAKRLNNIAAVLNELDRPAEGVPLLKRALEIDEEALGPDHRDVAHRLCNLAVANWLSVRADRAGRLEVLERARADLDRAREIYARAVGPDHWLVGKTLMNIGCVEMDRGGPSEAKRWFAEALEILEDCLEPDHPDLALGLKNLGEVHRELGDIAEARSCFDRALAIERQAFGNRHRELGLTFEHLGLLAQREGGAEEAVLCFERALGILESTAGAKHRDTNRVRGRLREASAAGPAAEGR